MGMPLPQGVKNLFAPRDYVYRARWATRSNAHAQMAVYTYFILKVGLYVPGNLVEVYVCSTLN